MLKYTLLESHLVKSNRIAPYFCPQSALIQAARQGLSARIRFANANMILNLALCFSSPRYRVFRKRSCFLTTPNTCSTFARTEDFACSAFFAAYWPLLLSFFTWDGRRLILYPALLLHGYDAGLRHGIRPRLGSPDKPDGHAGYGPASRSGLWHCLHAAGSGRRIGSCHQRQSCRRDLYSHGPIGSHLRHALDVS